MGEMRGSVKQRVALREARQHRNRCEGSCGVIPAGIHAFCSYQAVSSRTLPLARYGRHHLRLRCWQMPATLLGQ